jgi:DinB superfamily
MAPMGLPAKGEAAPYYSTYIDRVTDPDISSYLARQTGEATKFLSSISEEKSLHKYEPSKWSIREAWNHVNDAERIFAHRALWFARGLPPLPSFDQDIAAAVAHADDISWSRHVEEFRDVRAATLSLFANMPEDAWMKTGIASDKSFTVRSLAYIIAGHVDHHLAILRERYL